MFLLERALNGEDYQFELSDDIEYFKINFLYNNQGFYRINNIYLTSNDNSYKRIFLYLALIFLIIDVIAFYFFISNAARVEYISILAITLLISLPLFYQGIHNGDDLQYHLLRIESIVHEIRSNNFPCRLSTLWIGGYGYPSSIYYGDILLYFPALLRLCGLSISSSYKVFVFAVNLLTVFFSEHCFKKIFYSKKISIICTLCYCLAPYRLTDVYSRSAVGEYCAFIFYPIIALIMYRIISGKNIGIKNNINNGLALSIGMSGLITCHILSTEMTIFALALTVLFYIRKVFTKQNIRTILIAIASTILLCLYFIVPFLDYYFNEQVKINYIVKHNELFAKSQNSGIEFSKLFGFFDNPFIGDSTGYSYNAGLILVIALFAAIYLWTKKRISKEIKVLSFVSMLFLFMSTNVFPWNILVKYISLFNVLAKVQFVWRYLGLAIIFLTLLLGFLLKENFIVEINNKKIFVVILLSLVSFGFFYNDLYDDYASRNIYYDTHEINTSHLIGAEYLRTGYGKSDNIFSDLTALNGGLYGFGTNEIDEIERLGTHYEFYCITDSEESSASIPFLNYKGYHAYDESGNELKIQDGAYYCININLPKNYDGNIYVDFITPWYWNIAFYVSIIFVIILAIYYFVINKKFRHNNSLL